MTDSKDFPSVKRLEDMEDAIRPLPTTGKNGTVTVNRDTAQDIADTLGKVRDQVNREIDSDPKPSRSTFLNRIKDSDDLL
jgi:hypothetical protein